MPSEQTKQADNFINKYSGHSESYWFYNNTVQLQFEPGTWTYLLVQDNEFIPQESVTQIVHILDKSEALIPWAAKMVAEKLLRIIPAWDIPVGERLLPQMPYADFEALVLQAKSAPRDKVDDACEVGHTAHRWIEQYIRAVLESNEPRKLELLATFPLDERAKNACIAALQWMEKHNVRWLKTEQKIYSRFYKYAGTMDGLAIVDSCDNNLCCSTQYKNHTSLIDWKTSNYLYIEYLFQTAAYKYAHEEEYPETVVDDRWVLRLGKDDAEFEPWYLGTETYSNDFEGFLSCLQLTRLSKLVKERMDARKRVIREAIKAIRMAEREAALKVKCKGADKYKGIRAPKCNNGNPCETCLAKYKLVQAAKLNP